MPEIRTIFSWIFKISFVALITVLMILWIITGTELIRDYKKLETQRNARNKNPNNKIDTRTLERIKGMIIFDSILQEVFALLAIIGVLISHRYILQTSMTLLTIVWLIAHYRIVDLIWAGSPVMISSHIVHFFVVSIGLVYTYFVREPEKSKEKGSRIMDKPTVMRKPA